MNWESFERIGLIATLTGFAVLGWFGWKLFTQNAEVLSRITTVEARLDSIIKTRSPVTESGCGRECVRDLVSQAVATISGIAAPVKQEVVEKKSQMVVLGPTTDVSELAQALNTLGVSARDVIAIFQAIKKAGALQAELVVI